MNTTFGENLRTTVFGQSHAEAIGCTIEGLPAGEAIDLAELAAFTARRAPGGRLATQRKEPDIPEVLCGLLDGVTCGAPLTAIIRNTNQRSQDYRAIADLPRPSHADLPAQVRYQGHQDVRGGGAFSGRLTAPITIAGGIALQILARRGIRIAAHLLSVGDAEDRPLNPMGEDEEALKSRLTRELPVLTDEADKAMGETIAAARKAGDSVGAVVECIIEGMPAGLGGPLFEGFDGKLAFGLMGIPGVKGVEFGTGFACARMKGSENNDPWRVSDLPPGAAPVTNRAGGIAGGITTAAPVIFRIAMKPTPSIALAQETISLERGENAELGVRGRHDPCIAVRAVPVAEAVAALAALDLLLDSPAVLPNELPRAWASCALEKNAK
ncbi:chorismate synthase [Sutterella sp.]|uniref:chorismate synthase n=1 Tax=Sutterella sp. TaxID=1981025 RepID=UPI0026E0AB42|nr:chorismate synthase [Sutterella sp.]MDO5532212.1 chorismate synthase [Sutterella sp.]